MTPTNPMPVNPLATGVVDMSNGQVQFNKHLGQMGMGIGVHGMDGGKVTFGRSKYGRQWTGINSMAGGTANFNGWPGASSGPFTGINQMTGGTSHFNFGGSPPTPSPPNLSTPSPPSPSNQPMPVNPWATGVVDMSNGQVQFNKHLGQMGMGIGVH